MSTCVGSVSPGRCSCFTVEVVGKDESNWCMMKKTNFRFASPCKFYEEFINTKHNKRNILTIGLGL